MRRLLVCAALSSAVVLAACDNDDLPSGPDDGEGGGLSTLSAPRAVPRFEVDVRASGSFRPGQPVQITLNARGLLRTNDAEVRLVLPEAAALRAGGGQRMHLPAGQAPTPELQERMALGRGQAVTRTANVTFQRPGYYQVIASVEQRSDDAQDERDAGGFPSNNVAHEMIWLWIAESGGGVTSDFETARIPPGMHVAPGPLTPQTEALPGASPREPGDGTTPRPTGIRASHAPLTGWVDLHAGYINPDAGGAFTPLSMARYEFYIYTAAGAYVEKREGRTPTDGMAYTACYKDAAGTYGSYRFRVFLANDRVLMKDSMVIDHTGWFSSTCGTVTNVTTTTEPARMVAHVYNNLDRDIRYSDVFFGIKRAPILVRVEATDYSSYEWHTTHQLRIDTSKDTNFPESQIWGVYGQFVQAHEYGHAFQYLLEPTVKETYYHDCGAILHPMGDVTAHGCALAEGFPDYYAVTVAGTYTGSYRTNIESAIYSPATAGAKNGSRIEGAVASFLYDLTDPANETHDVTAYPGSWVANVMRTCEVQLGTTWVHQRGSDHLTYCFMAQPTDVSQFARTNGVAASAVYEPAADPEDDATRRPKVRKNYQKNLFGYTI
jgi:hypothetical protein